MSKLDLSWGNPKFLYPYWKEEKFNHSLLNEKDYILQGGLDYLKLRIVDLHKLIHNIEVTPEQIVIGNGATQILDGLIEIFNKNVWAPAPYYPRYPIITKLSKLNWEYTSDGLIIVADPNNPTNESPITFINDNVIWDMSYNWPQYVDVRTYNKDIMVYSLAKATGHASTRIGWAIIKDLKLAKKLTEFIEYTTCGISIDAQKRSIAILDSELYKIVRDQPCVFDYGKSILNERWKILKERTLKRFTILNNSGMFAWCYGDFYDEIGILSGSNFGVSDSFFRINIGCSDKEFKKLIEIIKV